MTLERGASVFGRVVTEQGAADHQTATAELRPVIDRSLASEAQQHEIEQLTETSQINEWGYFHFDAVLPQIYELTARQPGFMPTVVHWLPIGAGEEVELTDPLVLRQALLLRVAVEPAQDHQGKPWQLRLLDAGELRDRKVLFEGQTDFGDWFSPPLPAGQYAVQVINGDGSRVAWREIELTETEQSLFIELDLIIIHGLVMLDGKPISARLTFGSRGSEEVVVSTDDEDEFDVVLPRAGEWLVDVLNKEKYVNTRNIKVEINREGSEGLLIELPNTVAHGEVVDAQGTPVPSAEVRMMRLEASSWAAFIETDGNGRFKIQGQPPGLYYLEAQDGDRRSGMESVQLSEQDVPPPLRLVLEEHWLLQGLVLSDSGPVPQATIMAIPITAQRKLAVLTAPDTRSEIDGSFSLQLTGSTELVRLIVLAPGYVLHTEVVARAQVGLTDRVDVNISRYGGNLELVEVPQFSIVVVNGEPLDAKLLEFWAHSNGSPVAAGEPVVVPAMPAGAYTFCRLTRDEAFLVLTGAAVPSTDVCSEGHLSAGGTLTLHLP